VPQLFGSIFPKNTATGRVRLTPGDWAELAKIIEGRFKAVMHFSESNGPGVFLGQPFDFPAYLFGVQVLDDTDPNEIVEAFSPILDRMLARNTHPYFHDRIARA
jgi:anaerobic ribonucleoside-triphosphate reductase